MLFDDNPKHFQLGILPCYRVMGHTFPHNFLYPFQTEDHENLGKFPFTFIVERVIQGNELFHRLH
jgi:hypothetical protein